MHKPSFWKGFTLIELLVVIAIIGILASIVIGSLSAARDKANIAAGQTFEHNLSASLGDNLLASWNFDDCGSNGASIADDSGSGYTGTMMGTPTCSSNTPNGSKYALGVNGTSQYMVVTPLANLQAPSVTFAAWIYPTNVTGGTIFGKEYSYKYRLSSGKLSALVGCTGSIWAMTSMNLGTVVANKWQLASFVVDSSSQTASLYLNGTLLGSSPVGCTITGYNTNNVGVGAYLNSSNAPGEYFTGQIDNARIYTKALSSAEISKLYATEASKYEVAVK